MGRVYGVARGKMAALAAAAAEEEEEAAAATAAPAEVASAAVAAVRMEATTESWAVGVAEGTAAPAGAAPAAKVGGGGARGATEADWARLGEGDALAPVRPAEGAAAVSSRRRKHSTRHLSEPAPSCGRCTARLG